MNEWRSVHSEKPNDLQRISGVIIVKINVNGLPREEIPEYMGQVVKKVTSPTLEAQGFLYYFLPVRDQDASMTFIDLQTMNYATS